MERAYKKYNQFLKKLSLLEKVAIIRYKRSATYITRTYYTVHSHIVPFLPLRRYFKFQKMCSVNKMIIKNLPFLVIYSLRRTKILAKALVSATLPYKRRGDKFWET
jgi:hypothetical protein